MSGLPSVPPIDRPQLAPEWAAVGRFPIVQSPEPFDSQLKVFHAFRFGRAARIAFHPHPPICAALRLITRSARRHEVSDFIDVPSRSLVPYQWAEMIPVCRCISAIGTGERAGSHVQYAQCLDNLRRSRFDTWNDRLNEAVRDRRASACDLQEFAKLQGAPLTVLATWRQKLRHKPVKTASC